MKTETVALPVVRRLPRYYRFLSTLKQSGIVRISSKELAARMGLTASQIRQDLNCFGGFGQQGYGYNVDQLSAEIERILRLDTVIPTIVIGAGNLGRALTFHLYGTKGIQLIGVFDKNPRGVIDMHPDLKVFGNDQLESFCAEHHPQVAILCIPGESAQMMVDHLATLGIQGFWNFTSADLHLPSGVSVENVQLSDSIMTLGYKIHHVPVKPV